jgi:hypothetical protein
MKIIIIKLVTLELEFSVSDPLSNWVCGSDLAGMQKLPRKSEGSCFESTDQSLLR